MFITMEYDAVAEFFNTDFIVLVEKSTDEKYPYTVIFSTGHVKNISQKLHDQLAQKLKPIPPVGEPLREIVGDALQDIKGRTD
jgi:protein-L-isoaspartate O-methyltransferase